MRAVHERYHPSKRNPWNEIECGDHYARSMASYGVYLAACGFEYHGPHGHIGFAPRLSPENFRCAFTCAEGWGSFTQTLADRTLHAEIRMNWGKLQVQTISLVAEQGKSAHVTSGGKQLSAELTRDDKRVRIALKDPLHLAAEEQLTVVVSP